MIKEMTAEAKLAFAMLKHPRLGENSPLSDLEESIVCMIVEATTEVTNVVREMLPGECLEVGPAEGSWAPRYVAIDGNGRILVSDYDNHQVRVFNVEAEDVSLERSVGERGAKDGQLSMPLGVAVSSNGDIVVADSRNHRLQVFSCDGTFVRSIGCKGGEVGEFQFPMGVAVDPEGNIAVADWGNNRIQIFDADGQFRRSIGGLGDGDGEFGHPAGVAWNEEGTVLVVADCQNDRVQVFEREGVFRHSIRLPRYAEGAGQVVAEEEDLLLQFSQLTPPSSSGPCKLEGPMGIAVDTSGNIVVADKNDRVQVFRQDGTFVRAVGGTGSSRGQLHGPGGVAVDRAGNIVVADCKNRRVQIFSSS